MQDYWLQLEKKRKSFNFQRIKMQQYILQEDKFLGANFENRRVKFPMCNF